jgi:hypothetical protein
MARRSRDTPTGEIVSGEDWLYQAILRNSTIYDDTLPTTNVDLMDDLVKMEREVSSRRSKRESLHVKERADDVRARLGYSKIERDFAAKIDKNKTDASIATVKARVDRANNLTDAKTKLATQRSQFNNGLLNDAKAALAGGTIADAAQALQRTLTDQGAAYDVSKPEISELGRQFFQMTLNKNLDKLTADEVFKRFKDVGGDQLAVGMKNLFEQATQADGQVQGASNAIDNYAATINKFGAGSRDLTPAEIQEVLAAEEQAKLSFKYLIGRSPEELTAELQTLADADTEYQRLLGVEEKLRKATFGEGAEGIRTRLGRIVANPDFQLWAKDNGYDNLGQASVDEKGNLSYTQGPDDERAMLRFAYQARTGKQSPWPFASRKTGEYVRVTITNDTARKAALDAAALGDDRYAVRNGALISRDTFAKEQSGFRDRGLVDPQVEFSDNGLIRMDGKVLKIEGNKLVEATAPAGTTFAPAMFANEGRFVTKADLSDVPTFAARTDFGAAEPADVETIQAKTGYQIVGADQIEGLGIQKFEGLRNKRNARTMGELGSGAFSIGEGNEKLDFGKDAQYEVLIADRPKSSKVTLAQRLRRIQDARERRRLGEPETPEELEAAPVAPARTAVSAAPAPAAVPAPAPATVAAAPAPTPRVQFATVDGVPIIKKPDGSYVSVLDRNIEPFDAARVPAGTNFFDAVLYENDAPSRYATVGDITPENLGVSLGYLDPSTTEGKTEVDAFLAKQAATPAQAPAPAPAPTPASAAAPAPAAAPEKKQFFQTKAGDVYKVTERGGERRLELVPTKPGQQPKVVRGKDEVDAELGKLVGADGASPLSPEDARQYDKVTVKDVSAPLPTRKVTKEGFVTRIEDGAKIRPTLGEEVGGAIAAGAKKVGEGVATVASLPERLKRRREDAARKKEAEERSARIAALPDGTDLPEARGAAGASVPSTEGVEVPSRELIAMARGREERLAGMAAGQTEDTQLQREAVALREATTQLEREREASRRGAGAAPSLERVSDLAKQRSDIAKRMSDLPRRRPDLLSVVDAPGRMEMETARDTEGQPTRTEKGAAAFAKPVEVEPKTRPLGTPIPSRVVAGDETGTVPAERAEGANTTADVAMNRVPVPLSALELMAGLKPYERLGSTTEKVAKEREKEAQAKARLDTFRKFQTRPRSILEPETKP